MESAQAQSGFAGKFNMRAKRDAFEQGQRDAQRVGVDPTRPPT
jgi:hypothetical protein